MLADLIIDRLEDMVKPAACAEGCFQTRRLGWRDQIYIFTRPSRFKSLPRRLAAHYFTSSSPGSAVRPRTTDVKSIHLHEVGATVATSEELARMVTRGTTPFTSTTVTAPKGPVWLKWHSMLQINRLSYGRGGAWYSLESGYPNSLTRVKLWCCAISCLVHDTAGKADSTNNVLAV